MKHSKIYTIVALALVALITYALNGAFTAAHGVVLAVAVVGGQLSPSMQAFRTNLMTKVGKEIWWKGKLSNLIAFIDYEKFKKTSELGTVPGSQSLEASIITMVRDFTSSKKGVKIDIPLTRPLTGQGKIGTAPISRNVEKRKLFYQKSAINMRRHGVQVRDNEMSEQVLDEAITMALMETGAADLKDWFSRLMPFEFLRSILQRYSENLYDSNWGLGYTQASHPNFYVQGSGQVAFTSASGAHAAYTFDAGYEVNAATALATLDNVQDDYFSPQSIRNMVALARDHKIVRVRKGQFEADIIMVHSGQVRQLRQDTEWKDVMQMAAERGSSNPIFTGAVESYMYEGALLVVDDTIPSGRVTGDAGFVAANSTNGLSTGICYGVSNYMDDPRDTGVRKPAIVLGQGAILAAEGKSFRLTTEVADHEQYREDVGRMIYGATRADIIDDDNYLGNGANKFYANNSSLVYFTYSPTTITI